ncbi:hypothetical protein D3C86_1465290 [compost metagenome]
MIEPEPTPKAAPAPKKVRAKKATSERYSGLKRCAGSASASTKGEPGRRVIRVQIAIMPRMVRPANSRPRFSALDSGVFSSAVAGAAEVGTHGPRRGSITRSVRNQTMGVKTKTTPTMKNQLPAMLTA